MNRSEIADFYYMAMGCDQRMKPLDDRQLSIWATLLEDIPYAEGRDILFKLYRVRRNSILQPGDIVEAWEDVQDDRKNQEWDQAQDCPVHEGQKLPYCRSCRADVLTGARQPNQIGVIL